jgi:nitroreductase
MGDNNSLLKPYQKTAGALLFFDLVSYATLAPSGHNTQPWRFSIDGNTIRIFPDLTRRLPVVDPDDHALCISLGCALENLILAANNAGYDTEVSYFPTSEAQECIVVQLKEGFKAQDDKLFRAILDRQSTRSTYDGKPIPHEHLRMLEDASKQEGVVLKLIIQSKEIEPIIQFVKQGNHAQFNDKAFVQELVSWIRFNKKEAEQHQDGLACYAMGSPSVPRWLGKIVFGLMASGEKQASICEKAIRSSSALMIFIAQTNNRTNWVRLGQSFERAALTAASLNIRMAHLNMPCEVLSVRSRLAEHLKLPDTHPLLLLRIGYAQAMPRSQRRAVKEVIVS